jgi:hypothetical protein
MKKTDQEIRDKLAALGEQWGSPSQSDSLDKYVSAQIEALQWVLGE